MKALEIPRRILAALGIGSTSRNATESGGVQSIQVRILGSGNPAEMRGDIPSMQLFGFASGPMPGAHHVIAFLAGDRAKGVAIASNDPRYRPAPAPGETILFNAFGMTVAMNSAGITVNPNGKPATIEGDLHVTGNVIWNYGAAGQTDAAGHEHGNGNNGANTTAPIAGT